jgi:hypothetical protein
MVNSAPEAADTCMADAALMRAQYAVSGWSGAVQGMREKLENMSLNTLDHIWCQLCVLQLIVIGSRWSWRLSCQRQGIRTLTAAIDVFRTLFVIMGKSSSSRAFRISSRRVTPQKFCAEVARPAG